MLKAAYNSMKKKKSITSEAVNKFKQAGGFQNVAVKCNTSIDVCVYFVAF